MIPFYVTPHYEQPKLRMGAVRSNFRGDREDMHQVIRGIN
jgi:hypothetical protein